MMSEEQAVSAEAAAKQRKGRVMMLAIIAIFVLPFFVLPLLMSPEKMGKTNKGILISPAVTFSQLQVVDEKQRALALLPQKKWVLLYILPSVCEGACIDERTHALYALRQVPIVQGRDRDRVQSLVLSTAAPSADLAMQLQKEFPALVKFSASSAAIDSAFETTTVQGKASIAGNIYLMSPDGYIFIYYAPEANEKKSLARADDITSDLKKSLQGSRI